MPSDPFDPRHLLDEPGDDPKARLEAFLRDGAAIFDQLTELDSLSTTINAIGGLERSGVDMALLQAVIAAKRTGGMTEGELDEWATKDLHDPGPSTP